MVRKKPTAETLSRLESKPTKGVPIRKQKESLSEVRARRQLVWLAYLLAVIVLGFITGTIQYTAKLAACGEPPLTQSLVVEGGSLVLHPGEKGYGPGLLNSYYCKDEAKRKFGTS